MIKSLTVFQAVTKRSSLQADLSRSFRHSQSRPHLHRRQDRQKTTSSIFDSARSQERSTRHISLQHQRERQGQGRDSECRRPKQRQDTDPNRHKRTSPSSSLPAKPQCPQASSWPPLALRLLTTARHSRCTSSKIPTSQSLPLALLCVTEACPRFTTSSGMILALLLSSSRASSR